MVILCREAASCRCLTRPAAAIQSPFFSHFAGNCWNRIASAGFREKNTSANLSPPRKGEGSSGRRSKTQRPFPAISGHVVSSKLAPSASSPLPLAGRGRGWGCRGHCDRVWSQPPTTICARRARATSMPSIAIGVRPDGGGNENECRSTPTPDPSPQGGGEQKDSSQLQQPRPRLTPARAACGGVRRSARGCFRCSRSAPRPDARRRRRRPAAMPVPGRRRW